jgi:hypothetical protein
LTVLPYILGRNFKEQNVLTIAHQI